MAIIDAVIRKKKLARSHLWQEREVALAAREQSARECSVASREHSEVLRYLWLQLETTDALNVQLLVSARHEEARCKQRFATAEQAQRRDREKVAQLESRIARLDKDIEKLDERRGERLRTLAQERTSLEALRLDEWVLGQYGRGAQP
jgi:TolA-binding protein